MVAGLGLTPAERSGRPFGAEGLARPLVVHAGQPVVVGQLDERVIRSIDEGVVGADPDHERGGAEPFEDGGGLADPGGDIVVGGRPHADDGET